MEGTGEEEKSWEGAVTSESQSPNNCWVCQERARESADEREAASGVAVVDSGFFCRPRGKLQHEAILAKNTTTQFTSSQQTRQDILHRETDTTNHLHKLHHSVAFDKQGSRKMQRKAATTALPGMLTPLVLFTNSPSS